MPAHNDIAFRLRARFEQARQSAALGGWEFVTDVDIDFQLDPEEVRAPDVAGFRRERWLPAWRRSVPIPEPPTWLCEIWSPSNSQQDREDLLRVYYDAGTG